MLHSKNLARTLCLLLLVGCDGTASEPVTDAGGSPPADPDAGPPAFSTEPSLPTATGTCPDMSTSGVVNFAPAGIPARDVQIYVSDAAQAQDGPLVFYWHGAGSQPAEAEYGMGDALMSWVLDAGGIVAAPTSDPASGSFPWFLTTGTDETDLVLADEILACAIQGPGIDTTRIHAMGMSAGGLHTSQMAFRRASYLASVAIYSGGLFLSRPPRTDDPNHPLAVLMFHGGPSDRVIIQFDEASVALWEVLDERGHLAVICDHGLGHRIPIAAQPDVLRFLEAHPFGTVPSPWVGALPADFYAACQLSP